MKKPPKTVLVTGVSTGIGRACAAALVKNGWRVFGSVRKAADGAVAKDALGERFTALVFDVTDRDGIDAAAAQVETALEGRTLAGLVNNAGIAVAGPVRYLDVSAVRRQFDVNVFGAYEVTQAFLPLLGADRTREGRPGRIVNMSSVAGKIPTPFFSPYAMSKHALEAFSTSLRRELLPIGIDVVVVGPGAVKTPIWDTDAGIDIEQYRDTEYGAAMAQTRDALKIVGDAGLPPEAVGKLVRDVLNAAKPKTRYAILRQKLVMWTLPRLMPTRTIDRILAERFGLLGKD